MKTPTPIRESSLTSEEMEAIRARAYELYEERGREDGHELDHWLQAKQEVMSRTLAMAASASASAS